MYNLTIVRHGQTTSYQERRFSGWSNTPLTDTGRSEAIAAGKFLKQAGHSFDVCFSSCLKRATDSAELILNELNISSDIVVHDWHLNERHYGSLQGELRKDMALKHSVSDVMKWRSNYDAQPPALTDDDLRWQEQLGRIGAIPPALHPRSESMRQAVKRTQHYWSAEIVPALKANKKVLVVAHTSTLRSLTGCIEDLTESQLAGFRMSTAMPRYYELDEDLKCIKRCDLTDNPKVKIREWVIHNKVKLLKAL